MSERAPDLHYSFESRRSPEKLENKPEKRFEWDPTDPRCEARFSERTLQQGYIDGMYDLNGRKITDPTRQESPTVIETTLRCQGCSILEQFQTEGMGFAATNEASRTIEAFLQQKCKKLLARGHKPGQIPRDLLPR